MDKQSNCEIHGLITFKHKINKKGEWWVCHECLKEQWRKSQKKCYKKNPEYNKQWQKDTRHLRKFFSVYLRMVLHIVEMQPE